MAEKQHKGEDRLMIGLEIHFQLTGRKLFCNCSTESVGKTGKTFTRKLSPTAGEMGHYDPAAEYERRRNRRFIYSTTDNSCLVEADEEPPHNPDMDAIITGLRVANALGCSRMDNVIFMRKVVVDGSNTSGFQRTGILGLNGSIETSRGPVRISTVCVEEDSARKMDSNKKAGNEVPYSLDRLGIPLLEIATEPDIVDGTHAVEVAKKIGYIVASTEKARGEVDSIRQDVNLSLGFGRVEMKGIQKLSLIEDSITHESTRQKSVDASITVFEKRGGLDRQLSFSDAREHFRNTTSKMLTTAFRSGKSIFCTVLPNMAGLLKGDGHRLGRDLADVAKAYGLGGIFHTDELPAFGITAEEVESLRNEFSPGSDDALMLIIAGRGEVERLRGAFEERIRKLVSRDFSETRGPLDDGTTKYLRPLPGRERMYPETDIPVIAIGKETRDEVSRFIPRSEDEVTADVVKEFSLSRQDARTIAASFMVGVLRKYAGLLGEGKLAARIMLQTRPEYERKYGKKFREDELRRLMELSAEKGWSRTSLEVAMEMMIRDGKNADECAREISNSTMSHDELVNLVSEIIKSSSGDIKTGSLIAKIKEKSKKSFDPRDAIDILKGMN